MIFIQCYYKISKSIVTSELNYLLSFPKNSLNASGISILKWTKTESKQGFNVKYFLKYYKKIEEFLTSTIAFTEIMNGH